MAKPSPGVLLGWVGLCRLRQVIRVERRTEKAVGRTDARTIMVALSIVWTQNTSLEREGAARIGCLAGEESVSPE
jgi:hypothetical protein